ncbi:hypothetical protein QVD17_15875 [Tagetes erecta]|uniref:YLP motif-containing protein 1 n=1 Tax=Tagetes erecta TaxID=13708 RepID=A0AAD8KQF9_TARER|nr:hypothetical protein QVD17_15875 [Tagetes erecta]
MAGNNICPICSISHFPFCPPPPPFIGNPRFHYSQPPQNNDYYHQRQPQINDYYHQHQPPPFHPQHHHTSFNSNYYTDATRPTWYGNSNPNPNSNMNPYNHPRGDPNFGIKRSKIDPSGGNERILKLIHDHGNDTTPKVVVGGLKRKMTEMNNNNYVYYDDDDQRNGEPAMQPNHNFVSSRAGVHHGYTPPPPPLPASLPPPLPPLPTDVPLRNRFFEPHASPPKPPSLFPFAVTSSVDSSSASAALENKSSVPFYHASRHAPSHSSAEEFHIRQYSSEKHARDIQPYPLRHLSSEKQSIIDASHIFKQPHRASRPDHFVVILRGLPGSGKSYWAKVLRDIEVENGGEAPRIHSMDEYFMTEVEKAEDSELSKSSSSRGKRQVMKTVMEYCYEPEMEEAYRASMLKAFKKTLDEGVYSFIIVDDRNLRVADFAQFWATAKRSGYEVYLVEASYKDPAGCAARNVHNFTLPDIQKMAGQWEEAPPLYLKMDVKSLLHGDGFDESDIQEVDMDMEDEDAIIDASQGSDVTRPHDETKDQADDFRPHDELKDVIVTNHQTEEVKDLSRSKWSNDLVAEEEGEKNKNTGGALSGLVQAYSSKEAKSVCWGDQGGNVGFSISATRKTNTRSLVIGPGPGYNLKSNPLSEEEYLNPTLNAVESRTQNVFQERIRAERESFKAVFDKRRQRIGGFNKDEE